MLKIDDDSSWANKEHRDELLQRLSSFYVSQKALYSRLKVVGSI